MGWLVLRVAGAILLSVLGHRCPAAVKIAVFLPETGRFADTAVTMRAAFELAVEQIEGEEGSELSLLLVDNYGLSDSARAAARRLAKRPDIVAWMGGYPSDCCREIADVAQQRAIPYLIVSASSDTLTTGSGENVFRLAPPTTDYNDGLLSWTENVIGAKRSLAVLYEDHPRWADAVIDLRGDLTGRWRGQVHYLAFRSGERDFSELIDELERHGPAAVWILGGTGDAARFLRQCRSADWMPAGFVVGAVSMVNRRLISAAEGAADYIFAPAVWWPTHPYPGVEQFARDLYERYGEVPDYHAAQAYAAVEVMVDAVARSTPVERGSIRQALRGTDLTTVFGLVRFEDYGGFSRQNRVRTTAMQLRGEQWQTIWPLQLAEIKYVYPVPDWRDRERERFTRHRHYLFNLLFLAVIVVLLFTAAVRRKQLLRRLGSNGR